MDFDPDNAFATRDEPDCFKWNLYNSVFFSFTAVTTIGKVEYCIWLELTNRPVFYLTGYGHLYPETDSGKIVCIFYSLLGVPLNAILIGSLSTFFAAIVSHSFSLI